MSRREDQELLRILQELEHTEFIYILADLCQTRGWHTYLNIGDSSTAVDFVANQIFPHPQSIAVIYFNQGNLTSQKVQEYSTDIDENSITIIAKDQPSEEALEVSSKSAIDIISLGDIVQDIVMNSGVDIVKSNINENSILREKYAEFFEQISSVDQEEKSDSKFGHVGIKFPEDNSNQADSSQDSDNRYYEDKGSGESPEGV